VKLITLRMIHGIIHLAVGAVGIDSRDNMHCDMPTHQSETGFRESEILTSFGAVILAR
jgi:hypothetical protein